ncbi:hypothetical protein NNC19_09515 [Clostridium sp. SHJSY1]|uniref:hypothetical protein n=1 Tax=Clostridium sp. SHJSY1 TaxID=2942483 RepID=UPI002876CAE9|nr:hypothetical protein [Clostridium sp. SHJSY1]MDS0525914.1 hypothetical protein [Clostridium sp. SHJSY1]
MEWKNIKFEGISNIEKCVGEFNITETLKTPYGKFKIKVYERQSGRYVGYTNLLFKNEDGSVAPGIGYGKTVGQAANATIEYFLRMIEEKEVLSEEDFKRSDYFEF